MTRTKMTLALAACAGTALAVSPGVAQEVDFSGQRITMIIPYQEGSGSTIHGRLFATALEEQLPGNPTIVVRNIDGGGSVRGINQFQIDSQPDGSIFAAIATGTFFQYILEDPAVAYPLPDFKPFLSSPFGLLIYGRADLTQSEDPVENVRYLIENPPVYGGSGATSSDLPALLAIDLLGIKPNYVFGISNAETRAGFERGEFSLNYDNMASWSQAVQPLVEDGVARPLFTFGFEENGEIVRDPMLPDVPTFLEIYEAVHGEPLSGIEYNVWKSLFDVRVMGSKMLVLPADTPQEIVDAFTQATEAALQSERLQGPQAELILGDYPQSSGEAAQVVFDGGLAMTDEEKAWLFDWLAETHQIRR